MGRCIVYLVFFLTHFMVICCGLLTLIFKPADQQDFESGCDVPPPNFSEADLVGTWNAGRPGQGDTLIIREDGTYKQISSVDYPEHEYESEWLPWRVGYSEKGIPYLYLEGMRFCAVEPGLMSCDRPSGESLWKDPCTGELYDMSKEGILIIYNVSSRPIPPPRGIWLTLFTKSIEGGWAYRLQEP